MEFNFYDEKGRSLLEFAACLGLEFQG